MTSQIKKILSVVGLHVRSENCIYVFQRDGHASTVLFPHPKKAILIYLLQLFCISLSYIYIHICILYIYLSVTVTRVRLFSHSWFYLRTDDIVCNLLCLRAIILSARHYTGTNRVPIYVCMEPQKTRLCSEYDITTTKAYRKFVLIPSCF